MSSPVLWIKYTPKAFEEAFEDFNKKVRDKQYKKFDYDTWCAIRKHVKTLAQDLTIHPITVSFQPGFTPDVTVLVDPDMFYHFNSKDGSFGQYLWKRQAPEAVIDAVQKYGINDCRNIYDFVIPFKANDMEFDWKSKMTLDDNYYKNLIHKKIVEDHDPQYKVFNTANNYKDYNKIIDNTKSWNVYNNDPTESVKHSFTFTDQGAIYEGTDVATVNKKPSNDTVATADILINDPATWAYSNTATKAYTSPLTTISGGVIGSGVVSGPIAGEVSISCDMCNSMGCKGCKNYEKNDGDKENKMKGFNFDFGKITNDSIRMSMYGMAVKNTSGVWTAYDKVTGDLMDVDVFNFDGSNFLFKMPVAIKDIAVGDVVIHARKPMFVVSKTEAGDLIAIDPVAGEKKTIMPSKNMFGFNFATKVVSLFDNLMGQTPTSESPFGNLWMLMLMDGKTDMKDMLVPMMLMNQANGSTNAFNPMMLMLMSDGDMKDMAIPLMLMNQVK